MSLEGREAGTAFLSGVGTFVPRTVGFNSATPCLRATMCPALSRAPLARETEYV